MSSHAVFEIDLETGEGTGHKKSDGAKAVEVEPEELGKKPAPPSGEIYEVGVMLWTKSSPGCVYYFWGGRWWKFCS